MSIPHLSLRIDERAILLSELVDATCRTREDLEPLRRAFVAAAQDEANEVPQHVSNEAAIAAILPSTFTVAEIDPWPTSRAEAEVASTRLISGLLHALEHPLKTVRPDAAGRLPDAGFLEAAQRLIALELMSVWGPRASAIRDTVQGRAAPTAPYSYRVRGSRPFPTEQMLRDQSGPLTTADVAKITALNGGDARSQVDLRDPVEVDLQFIHSVRGVPNSAGWRSLGWEVIAPEAHELFDPTVR